MQGTQVRQLLDRLSAGRWGSVRLALALGAVSIPMVMWAIANPTLQGQYVGQRINLLSTLLMAIIVVTAAGLAGGYVGGRLANHATVSVVLAVAVAWFVGVAALPIAASLAGVAYVGANLCFDGCQPLLTSLNPMSGVMALALGVGVSTAMIVPPVVAIALIAISRRFARRGEVVKASALIVVALSAVQSMVFAGGGAAAIVVYSCLGIGVIIWASAIVAAPAPSSVEPESASAPIPG